MIFTSPGGRLALLWLLLTLAAFVFALDSGSGASALVRAVVGAVGILMFGLLVRTIFLLASKPDAPPRHGR